MKKKHLIIIFLFVLIISAKNTSYASKWQLNSSLVSRVNALGLSWSTSVMRKFQLFKSENPLFKSNYLGLGYQFAISPVQINNGPFLRLAPALFFNIDFSYNYVFGWRELAYSSIYEDISESKVNDDKAAIGETATGHRVNIKPNIFLKFGNIVLINRFDAYYMNMGHSDIYYNPYYDHVQKDGWNWENDTMLLYFVNPELLIGIDTTTTYVKVNGYQKTNLSFMLLLNNLKLIDKNESLMFRIGFWVKDKFRKDEYAGLYFVGLYNWAYNW